jgi:hypothetical protein
MLLLQVPDISGGLELAMLRDRAAL